MPPTAPFALRGYTVLVLEDEALLAMELAGVLRQQGYVVIGPASSVDQALALIALQRPDAALLDLNLGGRPALPVALALSADDVPYLVISGYSKAESGEPALDRVPWLSKPVVHRELVRALTQMLAPPSS